MRTLYVFGLVVLWQNQFVIYTCAKNSDLVERKCKYTENTIQRLKTCLFRNYDNTVHPNYLKGITNVTLKLMPKVMEFSRNTVLSLHSWILLTWEDPQLTWTPKNYDGITFIHVKSWEIWMPDVSVFNSGDMSSDLFELSQMDCLLFNEGSISCVPAVKFMSKCDTDFIYWPYDKHQCHVTFGSWSHKGEELDLHIDGEGISMSSFWNTEWDFKFISSAKQVYKYDCCPNETYPKINYNFLLTRYYDKHHIAFSIPVIVLILITVTVFWLDTRSVERLMLASVNLICHLLCMFYLHWQLPYNGTYTPNIMLFYRESLALAIFAVILTAILRKLEDMSTEIPNWVLSLITLILNNKTGRFLILKNEESKITNEDTTTKEHLNIAKSLKIKESWKHFTVIIDWLSFFCVVFIYIIILIILVPVT